MLTLTLTLFKEGPPTTDLGALLTAAAEPWQH